MDAIRFDRLTRALTNFSSRRAVTGIGLGGALGSLLGLSSAEAKRKKRRKKTCKKPCAECERCKKGKCKPRSGADCGNGGVCEGRECVCPNGTETCGDACVDLLTDPAHCGACDTPCPSLSTCVQGTCTCDPSAETCGEACVDLLTDAAHCGACDTPCPSGSTCVHGACTCDPFANTCPTEVDGQCSCGAIVAEEFTAACVSRNSACDLDRPCESNDDCPPRSVCLLGCADPPAPNPKRCSNTCDPV